MGPQGGREGRCRRGAERAGAAGAAYTLAPGQGVSRQMAGALAHWFLKEPIRMDKYAKQLVHNN